MYSTAYDHLPDPERQYAFYEGVALKRGIAWLIDTIIVAALLVPVVVMTAFVGLFFLPFLFLVVSFIYRVATIAAGSATWGMWMMAIEFRDAFGRRLDFGQALLHTLGYTVSFAMIPLQLISIACMLVTQRGQGLTDMVLGTTALNRRA